MRELRQFRECRSRAGLAEMSDASKAGIFETILGAQAEKVKMIIFQAFFMFVWVLSLFYVLPSGAFLAAWPAAPRTCKNLENPLVFVGRKPYAPFSRSARSNRISEDTRSQH